MKKVLFSTNLPSPYRVDFFNEFGKYCKLTVCFERMTASDRDEKWKGNSPENFDPIFLGAKPMGTDATIGLELAKCVKKHRDEIIIFTNYVSPSTILAILYCRFHRIPYLIEHDGGFLKKDPLIKGWIKKFLLKGAKVHLTTCEYSVKYLKSIGVDSNKIFKYPFSSLSEQDIDDASIRKTDKKAIREKLGITEKKIVLYVGRLIQCKGIDVLINAERLLDKEIGFYLIGGVPPEEYKDSIEKYKLDNFHFIDFKTKDELAEYYSAADVFVLPTRGDVWGLVVNEAMAFGLPIVSTDRCIAAVELIGDDQDGSIVPADDSTALSEAISYWLKADIGYSISNVAKIREYTIERMSERHVEILFNQRDESN